jgi:hypothetical protein
LGSLGAFFDRLGGECLLGADVPLPSRPRQSPEDNLFPLSADTCAF